MSSYVSYTNLIDSEDTVLSLVGATVDPLYPISNLKLRGLGSYMQLAVEFDPLTIDVDFGNPVTFNLIGVMGLGIADPAIVDFLRVGLSTSTDGVSYTFNRNIQFSDLAPLYLPGTLLGVIPEGLTSRYIRINYTGSTLAQPSRVARLWVDNALLLGDKIESSPDFDFRDPGELSETDGQQYVEFRKQRTRAQTLTLRNLTTLQAWGFEEDDTQALAVSSINGLQLAAGTTGEVIVLPHVTDTAARDLWIRRTGIYGHVTATFPIREDQQLQRWTAGFSLLEER